MENNEKQSKETVRSMRITILPSDEAKLRNVSPRAQVSDGIRIVIKESEQYRKEREALRKVRESNQ